MNTDMIEHEDTLKRLALAVARNRVGPKYPIEDVLLSEGVPQSEFSRFLDDAVFSRHVTAYVTELTENGFSFKAKCRVLAEDAVKTLYHMARDPDAPAASRVKCIENLVQYADLAPKPTLNAEGSAAPFHITFNIPQLGDQRASITIDQAPVAETFSMSFTPDTFDVDAEDGVLVAEDADAYEEDPPPRGIDVSERSFLSTVGAAS